MHLKDDRFDAPPKRLSATAQDVEFHPFNVNLGEIGSESLSCDEVIDGGYAKRRSAFKRWSDATELTVWVASECTVTAVGIQSNVDRVDRQGRIETAEVFETRELLWRRFERPSVSIRQCAECPRVDSLCGAYVQQNLVFDGEPLEGVSSRMPCA